MSAALPAKAENLFRSLFEQASLGIAVEDLDGRILLANHALCSMLGYQDDELAGMSCSQFAGPEDSKNDWALFQQLRAGAMDHYSIEKRYVKKDGAPLWGRLNVSLLKQGDEESPLVFAFVENITDHKLAEEALHQKEKELTETQHQAGIGSWSWDARSDRVLWSKEISLRAGYDPSLPGPDLKDQASFFTPESWNRLQQSVQEALQTGRPCELDLEIASRKSTARWATARGEPLRDANGEIIGLHGTIQDITEQKLAEQDLARTNDRFRLAMEASKSVGWEWDLKSGELSWFGDLQSMFGIPSDSFDGGVEDFYRSVHPEDRKMVAEAVADARQNGKQYTAEFRVVRRDGTVRWVAARRSFEYEANGEPARMMGVAVDITDRRMAEEALRGSEQRLRLAIHAGRMYAYEWNVATDEIVRSKESVDILNWKDAEHATGRDFHTRLHPDDEALYTVLEARLTPDNPIYQLIFRTLSPDGSVIWLEDTGRAFFDAQGRLVRVMGMVADTTERKQTEEALRQKEAELTEAQRLAGVGNWHWDSQKDKVIWSKELYRLLGRDPNSPAPSFKEHPGLYTAESWERLQGAVREALQTGAPYEFDMEILTPKSITKWVTARGETLRDPNGQIVGLRGTVQDITERKHADQALRESEARERARVKELEAILDAVPVPVLIAHDAECRHITGNRAASEQLREARGQNLSQSAPPGERPAFRQIKDGVEIAADLLPMQQAAATGRPMYRRELTLLYEDGTTREEIANAVPLLDEDGKPRGAVGASIDVTELKRTERALRESEDKLRLLLDSTAEAIYGVDLEHRCTFCNPASLRALGFKHVDEMLGKNMHQLIHHTRRDGTPFPIEECQVHRVTRTREGTHAEDEVLWRANGTSFPVEYWSYPQRRGHEVVGAVVTFIDITERKLAEAALADVSRKLIEAQEQERTRIGRELHDDIGQRLALLAVELQRLKGDPLVLPRHRSRLGGLQKKASEIAADTQSLSHELHSARLQYLGITAAMRGFCREFGEQQKVKVDFKANDLPGALSPDISLCLFRILQEALHNSAKHSGALRFEVHLWGTANDIHLNIKDSGKGFDREAARTSQGIGLISMEERLKIVNGTLSIESQPGHGTTIEARVPVSSERDSMRAAG